MLITCLNLVHGAIHLLPLCVQWVAFPCMNSPAMFEVFYNRVLRRTLGPKSVFLCWLFTDHKYIYHMASMIGWLMCLEKFAK
jgi:hypothetical protein